MTIEMEVYASVNVEQDGIAISLKQNFIVIENFRRIQEKSTREEKGI